MARTPATTEQPTGKLTHVISHRHQLQDGQQFRAGQVVPVPPEHADAWAAVIKAQPAAFGAWDPDAKPEGADAKIGTPPADTDAVVEVPPTGEGDDNGGTPAVTQPEHVE